MADIDICLPNGETLQGGGPVVIIGPNGSGKTRKAREMRRMDGGTIEFVNALRNTRVATQLPTMGQDDAQVHFVSQRNQAQSNHWELSSEFDYMLSRLIGEHSDAAMRFTTRYRDDPKNAGVPEDTALTRVGDLWKRVFVGRQLRWENWKPTIDSITSGTQATYSGNFMSDGEKAALYLAGRVFSADPNLVLVVDEPETHFHHLLAIRLWDALEVARPDLRFVYITHDLTFGISRTNCTYVLASPTAGLRRVALGEGVPDDVAAALLGSASLSFYASRVVFCEGSDSSYDSRLFNAWFNGSVNHPGFDARLLSREGCSHYAEEVRRRVQGPGGAVGHRPCRGVRQPHGLYQRGGQAVGGVLRIAAPLGEPGRGGYRDP